MQARIFTAVLVALVWSVGAAAKSVRLTREVLEMIPSTVDIKSPEARDGRRELEGLLSRCGPGVVEGAASRAGRSLSNRCSFQVKLDELFFRPAKEKTGLLSDPDWAYRDGVTFFEPPTATVPDSFDLRDLMKNGQPEIRKQNCGDCWAWATHHGLEVSRAVHDQKAFDHSIQTVLSCSKKGSCGGGYMSAVDFLIHGLPYETDFPYAGSDKTCKYSTTAIAQGWDAKVMATPYVGTSLSHSMALQMTDGTFREGNKVQQMMAAMYQWKTPLVVTVAAYSISGAGIYNSCSAINSGGDHMVTIVGWDTENGKRNAHVWNSWGPSHGDKGVSRILWECGDGKLNRGLGVEAKIIQYKPPCTPPDATQTYLKEIMKGQSIEIGSTQSSGSTCSWTPTDGLSDPHSCVTSASPTQSTEYHLTVDNACGKSSSMALVYVWGATRAGGKEIVRTAFGDVEYVHRRKAKN